MARKPKPSTRRARGSGSIFWSAARGRWVGRQPVGKTPAGKTLYREVWGKTQGEVVRRMREAAPPGPDATVKDWEAKWWKTVTVRPTTKLNYRQALDGHVLPAIGNLKLTAVTATHIEGMAAALLAVPLATTTVATAIAVTRIVFEAAVRAGLIPRNPVAVARKHRVGKAKVVTYTPAELLRVIGAADWYSGGGPVSLMAACGCRVGEAIALDVPDFDPAAGTIAITRTAHPGRGIGPPKSANGVRTIRVPAVALPALVAAASKRTAGPLFVTGAGRRYVHQMVGRGLAQTLAALGLAHRRGHIMRHSVATHLIAAGVPLADVAVYLGDSVATIVRTYCHPTGTDPAAALDRLYGGRKVGDGDGTGEKNGRSA